MRPLQHALLRSRVPETTLGEGGHDKLCKLIKKAGGAEQYNANKKYAEAVAVAAEACAEDTKGQTCFICTQALHWKTKEGPRAHAVLAAGRRASRTCRAWRSRRRFWSRRLRRTIWGSRRGMRGSRGGSRAVCVNNNTTASCTARSGGRAGRRTLGRPEADASSAHRHEGQLGNRSTFAGHYDDAVSVKEAELATLRRIGGTESDILITLANLAGTYDELGRREDSLRILQDVYSRRLEFSGEEHVHTISAAINYAVMLNDLEALRRSQITVPQSDSRGATRSRGVA